MDSNNLKPERLCCVCDKQLYGRSDKIYCDSHCKNRYHADVRRHTKSASAATIQILHRNYQILCMLLGDNKERYVIKKLALQQLGFNFENITGMSRNHYGMKFDIFELSWYYSSNDNVVVLQDREQSKFSPFMYKRWERHYKPLQNDSTYNAPTKDRKARQSCANHFS